MQHRILTVLGSAAVFATLAKIGESLVNLAMDAAAVGDNIDKSSARLGFSAESYQKWSFIMERSGSSIDSMGRSMNQLTQIMNG